jgi:hypothetical protein
LSIQAEAVPLGSLLGMLDQSTGMSSRVPPELANRNISVQFADLSLNDGVRKIFEGQRLDYIYLGGKGIIVTAASLSTPIPEQPALAGQPAFGGQPAFANEPPFNPNQFNPNQFNPNQNDAFVPPAQQPVVPQPAQGQPAMIQTPFGPIPNPRVNQGAQQPGGMPIIPGQQQQVPGQQNSLGAPGVFGAPSALTPTPLGDNNVFGSPTGPANSPLGSGGIPGLTPSRP